jgi:tetratricopeptide (TPR) repeat protein
LIHSRALVFLAAGLFAAPCAAQKQKLYQNQLDTNAALFTVMAAINAAGYDADIDSPFNAPLRKEVRASLAGKHTESMDDMKRYFIKHRQADGNAELSQYISFALSIDGPPGFHFKIPENEIPPDVSEMRGLELILPKFWEENGLAQLWQRAQPDYEEAIAAYHSPVTQVLLQANAYLRNPTSGFYGRRFQIFVDLLAAPNQVQSRSYKDDYYVVVTPSPELPIDQIQYAYLHYLLDPLALRYSDLLTDKRGLESFAKSAPALENAYKDDYLLLTTSCLVKAVQSRLLPKGSDRAGMVDQALREGFVYTPAFADGLPTYEKQPQAMQVYIVDLIKGIDLAKEDSRLENVQFARERNRRVFKATVAEKEPEATGAAKTLETAEDLYRGRRLDEAKETYLRSLQETSQQPLHARAYYGLARIAALQKDPELAEKLFKKTLELSPDPETKSWAYYYLGRLAMAAGEMDEASRNYRATLAIDGASEKAKAEAAAELEKTANKK